jgi:hypothetical protein
MTSNKRTGKKQKAIKNNRKSKKQITTEKAKNKSKCKTRRVVKRTGIDHHSSFDRGRDGGIHWSGKRNVAVAVNT